MPLPSANLTIKDGGLGLVPQDSSGIQAIIGTCSAGTVNEVNGYGNIKALQDALGSGPLVEAAALVIDQGGGPVYAIRATGGTAGSAGAVTQSGTGTSVMTVTGTPLDSYLLKVKVTTAAAAVTSGLGTFQVSLDGGLTYGPDIALPTATTYAIPNTGLTLNFAAGTLVAGDTYSSTCTGPAYTLANLQSAMTALLADPRTWFMVHAVGVPADTSAAQAIFGALDGYMAAAAAAYRYTCALMQAPDQSDSANISAFSAQSSSTGRVMVAGGFATILSPISGMELKRPGSWQMAVRAAQVPPSEDLGRVRSGSLGRIISLSRNEEATPGLDAARFATLRSHTGLPGYFITNGRMMSSPASDFQHLQHRRVMDIASTVVRAATLQFLNSSVRVNATTGLILEADAVAIEEYVAAQLRAAVTQPGYASDATAQVDRTNNILSTGILNVNFSVVPLGYLKTINGTIGFYNPALVAAA